jgi:Domain of Unknown Function (DUF1206)
VQHPEHSVREAQLWLVRLGRFGYVAKGVVYILVGVLALQTALGARRQATGSEGALEQVGEAPFGKILLLAIGVGIVGYAIWRLVQAFLDTENKGRGLKGLSIRFGYFVIALIHAGLATSALALASGSNATAGDSARAWTAQLMSQPFGRWLVAIVGAIVIAHGAMQLRRAYTLKFREKLKLTEMNADEDKWATRLGRVGYAARGIVFGLVGTLFVAAAIYMDPQQARGLDGALQTLARQPWGSAALAAVAVGLTAYGLFMFLEARYRRMVIT